MFAMAYKFPKVGQLFVQACKNRSEKSSLVSHDCLSRVKEYTLQTRACQLAASYLIARAQRVDAWPKELTSHWSKISEQNEEPDRFKEDCNADQSGREDRSRSAKLVQNVLNKPWFQKVTYNDRRLSKERENSALWRGRCQGAVLFGGFMFWVREKYNRGKS